jgi:signal transduction histidine kinase
VLFEPHPETRRRSDERRIRRALADKLRELAAANQMLEEHARRRSRFVSDAAHELKTPLAILRSYLETLNDDLADGLSGEQREFLRAAIHGARRLQRLIEELLDLAALEGGHLAISLGPVAARQVIAAAVDELGPVAAQGGVVLSTRSVDDLQVRSDPERLGQVVRNLVENGLKYTRRGGEVTVDLTRQGERGVLSVHDNGVGIAPEALPRIFDEFVRGPNSQAAEGAGLGLAIVRRLVLAMGGRVWVDSSPGRGSRFFVELPLWSGDA